VSFWRPAVEIVAVPLNPDDSPRDQNDTVCPYCGQVMKRGYFLISGGVIFAESTATLGPLFANKADIEGKLEGEKTNPLNVIVSAKGWRLDPQNWPKPGMFCQACLTIVMKIRKGQGGNRATA
jgi:hypothetical protein